MGLTVDVYRNGFPDCTNQGISCFYKSLVIVNIEGPSEPSHTYPAAMLVHGYAAGTVRIVPAVKSDSGVYTPDRRWTMMGGNYAATSDSRFTEAIQEMTGMPFYGAVPIHDRIEA